jgi:transposase
MWSHPLARRKLFGVSRVVKVRNNFGESAKERRTISWQYPTNRRVSALIFETNCVDWMGNEVALNYQGKTLRLDRLVRRKNSRGRPAVYDRRSMVDACCYILRTGCSWRMLPKGSFPPWPAVQKAFLRWAAKDRFEQLQDRLRQQWRLRIQRNPQPTTAVIDSQSTRSSPQGGEQGYDAGKKVKGRKRHLVVDSLGLLLAVSITTASTQDRDAAPAAVAHACAKTSSIQRLFADSAYAGRCAETIVQAQNIEVHIVRRPPKAGHWNDEGQTMQPAAQGFPLLHMRWVVERTHAWNERWRRLVMHHDRTSTSTTAWIWLAQARLLTRRLTQVG